VIDLAALDERIRQIVREEARPRSVSQRPVSAVLGRDREAYLRLARRGAWPSSSVRRLVTSRTADVAAYLDAQIDQRAARELPAPVTPIDAALRRVGARRIA